MSGFGDRVVAACQAKHSRLMVGLDPHWDRIPAAIKAAHADRGGAIADFLIRAVDATLPYAVAYKPQIAFFEACGAAGFRALERVIAHLRETDALIVADGKRNDIGSTAAGYADAYFDSSERRAPFSADALTVNAYLGGDGLDPFLENPEHGIFVLVKTSNPSSGQFQDLVLAEGGTLAERVAAEVERRAAASAGASGYGQVGAVVGATYPEHMQQLRRSMPHAHLLVPGYGAQGGALAAVRAAFDADGEGALINSARAILFPADFASRGFAAIGDAAARARDEIERCRRG